jgi:hypothetical protein
MAPPPKKKAKPTKQGTLKQTMLRNPKDQLASANKLHVGKRVLLKAISLYSKKDLPKGEEKHLFQYTVVQVNPDLETVKLEYENKFIIEGGKEFQNYPLPDSDDVNYFIDEYRIELLPKDAELYKKYIGIENKIKEDAKEKQKKEEADIDREAAENVEDIDHMFLKEEMLAFDVLMLEFEADGDLVQHVVEGTKNKGKVTTKQQWSKSCDLSYLSSH